jgi:uroporphyrin-III C-methyltransferase/precorrin-2 dehydrogenase/sirohydrochlorin ferrochelatase
MSARRVPPGSIRVVRTPAHTRQVLVVGGGPHAAWFVDDLARSDHPVRVVAPRLCDDMVDMLCEHRFTWISRDLVTADVDDVWLAIVATGDLEADLRWTRCIDAVRNRLGRVAELESA